MRRSFAIVAVLATALSAAACTSMPHAAQPESGAGVQPQAAEAGEQPATDASESAQDSALRSDTFAAAAQGDPGEPGLPAHSGASIDDVLRLGAVASWAHAPEVLAISLPATADCWAIATAPVVLTPDALSIEFVPGEGCGEFDTARTYTVEVPAEIEAAAGLEVSIEGLQHHFTLTLPGS